MGTPLLSQQRLLSHFPILLPTQISFLLIHSQIYFDSILMETLIPHISGFTYSFYLQYTSVFFSPLKLTSIHKQATLGTVRTFSTCDAFPTDM